MLLGKFTILSLKIKAEKVDNRIILWYSIYRPTVCKCEAQEDAEE